MDIRVVGQQALLRRMVEIRAVVNGSYLGGGATEDFGLPGIEVGIEVDYGDGSVGAVDGAEEWECDGVVAAEGDDSWEGLAVFGRPFLFGVCGGGPGEDAVVAFFDLVERPGVVVSVANGQYGLEGIWGGTYDVTGMSPQSKTVAQLLKGFVAKGTLYPPLKPTLREPVCGRDQLVCCGDVL
jgi:hypothetical protein